ncbi:prepilin-type N-terminal cleavage/methylation domain-containing protein [Campylobacter fetus]|nr:type II secretion system protein [Campylobacter fetus]RUT51658.1 prepilin-type N-terminal cleavage/methylation domain-containing protein [Campylobacter fetus]RUT52386.1 prepilin-type N-terminal cleavage/methylation domain-containing protein [Campylobacter fetus]
MKRAFTMIELVVAIVISGILLSIGVKIFNVIYTNYIRQKSIVELESISKTVIEQIEKRLSYRIKPTLSMKIGDNYKALDKATEAEDGNEKYPLIWYMQSYETQRIFDSVTGNRIFGWSGFINLDKDKTFPDASGLTINSPGSNFSKIKDTITDLGFSDLFIVFKVDPENNDQYYKKTDNINPLVHKIEIKDDTNLSIKKPKFLEKKDTNTLEISELYYLSHSINQLSIDNSNNLLLTEFIPFGNNDGTQKKVSENVLTKNVSSLRFMYLGGSDSISIKLCLEDPNFKINDQQLEVCKTQVVQ